MRRAHVNDVVHSFAYSIRQNVRTWPCVILQQPIPAIDLPDYSLRDSELAPFVTYALSRSRDYLRATSAIILLVVFFRTWNTVERIYATYLLHTYYVSTRPTQSISSDQLELF